MDNQDPFRGLRVIGLIIAALLGVAVASYVVNADTGKFAATRREAGNTAGSTRHTLATNSVTTIVSAADNRPDLACFNNSASHVFISSAGATLAHFPVSGFIVLSSATVSLGSYAGDLGAVLNSGVGELRCWSGTTQ